MPKRPASSSCCGCSASSFPPPPRSPPSTSTRARPPSAFGLLLAALALLLTGMAPAVTRVQALSPSKMIASFAAQQRRSQGYHHNGGAGSTSGRMAAAAARRGAYDPIPPQQPQAHVSTGAGLGGRTGRRLPMATASASAFLAGAGDNEFVASWRGTGGAGAQVWQPPRPLLGGPGEMAGSMGVSGLSGMAAGYVAKRFGRMLSFACGFVLVSMKVAEELGYVAVNWAKIEEDARSLGRSVWGRDGTVRKKAERFASSWQRELGQHAGIAGSFAAGFAYGFRA